MATGGWGGRGESLRKHACPETRLMEFQLPPSISPSTHQLVVVDRRAVVMVRGLGSSGPLSLSGSLPHISLRSGLREKRKVLLCWSRLIGHSWKPRVPSLSTSRDKERHAEQSRVVVVSRRGGGRGEAM